MTRMMLFSKGMRGTFIALASLLTIGASLPLRAQNRDATLVFSLPIGPDGVTYEGVGVSEVRPWGPAAFTIAPDGSFWIADTAGKRLLHYNATGQQIARHNLAE